MLKLIPSAMFIDAAREMMKGDTAENISELQDCKRELHEAGIDWADDTDKVRIYMLGLHVAAVLQSMGSKL